MEMITEKANSKNCHQVNEVPQLVHIPESKYLSLSGIGAPESDLFKSSTRAIYAVASAVREYYRTQDMDFEVPNLECYWWVESEIPFNETPKMEWFWELVIRMPEYVDTKKVDEAIWKVIRERNLSLANEIYLNKSQSEEAVQIMHKGSYENEGETIEQLMDYIKENELSLLGRHHEIYMSDPTTTEIEKQQTILRYAVK